MKINFCAGAIAFLMCLNSCLYAGGTLACGGELKITLNGGKARKDNSNLIDDLQALIESCSVDSSSYAASEKKWKTLLGAPSFLHYVLPKGMKFGLRLNGGELIEIEEVILPLPSGSFPDHIYVKNKNGYRAYTKYDPRILQRIVSAPEVGLASAAPYSSLPTK